MVAEVLDDIRKLRKAVFSKGIYNLSYLSSFIGDNIVFRPEHPDEVDVVLGWGKKDTAIEAFNYALAHKKTYLALEDGFVRSIELGVMGAPPFSISIDPIGIYYDATGESYLENLLNSANLTAADIELSNKAINFIVENRITKYNNLKPSDLGHLVKDGVKNVLVIDQTFGDKSIQLGLASQQTFNEMLEKASNDNPDACIYVKVHPDVLSGKKQGNIDLDSELCKKAVILDEEVNSISLLEKMDEVYVVTSQMGFEALLMGKKVHVFGAPFYMGWGLTNDAISLNRRTRKRTVEEVFALAYIKYCKYINPATYRDGNIFDVLNYILKYR